MASRRAASCLMALAALAALTSCAETRELNPLERAIATNESRHVAERFEERPVVVDDTQGVASLRLFFSNSETLVVSDATVEAQLRAASIAVAAHAPMIVYDPARHQEISQEVERLRTHTVLTVGDVSLARTSGRVRVYRDPGGPAALGVMMAVRFNQRPVSDPADAVAEVAALDPRDPTWLRATWAEPAVMKGAEAKPFPIMSRRDAQMAPAVVATAESSIASVANARSFGADVVVVDDPDPRASEETLFAMAGLADLPLVALGAQFGPDDKLRAEIMQAEESYLLDDGAGPTPAH
ncbi:hypothetical protein V6D40_03555 [Corynebacterium sp. Q4381]|uniref:hypothetical protein n=1 Tax=Corynebacterium sp. Marseille-Q4381 TaxID=3121597 RepID=UPI002FE5D684